MKLELRKWEVELAWPGEPDAGTEIVEATNCFVQGSLAFAVREGQHYHIVKAFAPGFWAKVEEFIPPSVTTSESSP